MTLGYFPLEEGDKGEYGLDPCANNILTYVTSLGQMAKRSNKPQSIFANL